MRIAQRKESPIIGLTGMGGGLASYILYGGSGSSVYEISRALRFNDDESTRLFRYVSTGGNRRTFTISFWTKRGNLGIDGNIFNASSNPGASDSTAERTEFRFNPTNDQIKFAVNPTGSSWITLETVAEFKDPFAWYHVVVSVDTTQATETNRVKIYVNGEQQALTGTYIGQDVETPYMKAGNSMSIGSYTNNNNAFYDGYLADFQVIDGQALDESSFGELDSDGIWNPKEYDGTYGTNGFHLKFDDTSNNEALGKDSSGNGTRLPGVSFGRGAVNDCIEIADSSDFTFGADDFTMEMWVLPLEFNSYNAFFMKYTGTRSTSSVWTSLNSDGNILYYLYHGSSETGMTTSGSGLNLGQWNHIAFVRQGETARCYINGVQEGTMDISTNTVNDSATPMRLGMDSTDAYDFDGYMSNVRIVKGTCLYNDGTTFTPPTAPLTNVTNTVLLCCQSETSASAAAVTPSPLVLYSDNSTLSPVSKSELDYYPVNLIAAQSTSTGYSDYVFAGDATYDNTETSTDYFTGSGSNRNLFNGTLSGQVGGQNISESWLYFRPATAITNVTSIRLYGSYNSGGTKINGTDSTAFPSDAQQWLSIANPPSTVTEIAVRGSGSAAARLQAIEINGVLLTDTKAATDDSVIDSPIDYTVDSGNNRGNYATFSPLDSENGTLSNGNLTTNQTDSATSFGPQNTTIGVSSGKWYSEITWDSGTYALIGITHGQSAGKSGTTWHRDAVTYTWYFSGAFMSSAWPGTSTFPDGSNPTFAVGDVVGVLLDKDDDKLYFTKNGSYVASMNAETGTNGIDISAHSGEVAFITCGNNASTATQLSLNAGQRTFVGTPPDGYLSLCTQNLPTPTIEKPSEHLGITTYASVGTATTIRGLSFSPDLVWQKQARGSGGNDRHFLTDSVRGAGLALRSDSTAVEAASDAVESFTSDGWTVGAGAANANQSGNTYVGWAWNGGGAPSKTYTVKVVDDGGNKYRFDDFGTSAVTLELEEGGTYTFDQSDSSNGNGGGHPLRFATQADAANDSEYTTGVETNGTPGTAGAYTRITVASGAPTLYYYCTNHSGMGGQVNTNSTTGSSNFDGSVQSVVKHNSTAGFSIVKWTSSNSAAGTYDTIGHELNASPGLVITKRLDTADSWYSAHGFDLTKFGKLDLTTEFQNAGTAWGDGITSSVIGMRIGNFVNGNEDMIAYCFSEVEGYSKFGTYAGTNADVGPYIYTGFRPAFVMIKNTTLASSAYTSWYMIDSERATYNPTDYLRALWANQTFPEGKRGNGDASPSGGFITIDMLSNGFSIPNTGGGNHELSQNSYTYLYVAFAEHPFKKARAR